MNRSELEAEIRRRAAAYLPQTHLVVDYYRIRRRLAYPLPVRAIHISNQELRGFGEPRGYPWATWMSWDLEERIGSLGWAGTWFEDAAARQAAARDLEALAAWPSFRQLDLPDLCLGHTLRILFTACTQWEWLGTKLRGQIEAALRRALEDGLPCSEKKHGAYHSREDILADPKHHGAVHNIPFIGTAGLALAAHAIRHPGAEVLDRRLASLLGALLELRRQGYSEGAAYDGYLMDFVAPWLGLLSQAQRAEFLAHPRFGDGLEQSYMLTAPGSREGVAELSDVEPLQMPFHISFQAKCHAWDPQPVRAWYLKGLRPERLRADALAALRPVADELHGQEPRHGALDAHYALVLRSGWERSDLAVAIAASNAPAGHIHKDNGSLVVGTAGRWLVTDPGYQQYLKTAERNFTLGVSAHNAPVINGQAQDRKDLRRREARELAAGLWRADLDLTGCYAPELNLQAVHRTVWLARDRFVVVADRVAGASVQTLAYHWHGHADAAWWVEENWATVYLPEASLRIASPQARIEESCLSRLAGSRGPLTLTVAADVKAPVVWWVFARGDARPALESAEGGREIRVEGQAFRTD